MNNEPVAWMLTDRVVSSVPIEGAIPLYTHPAKTLTDEEISEVMYQCDWQYDPESFAKAILKKASEK